MSDSFAIPWTVAHQAPLSMGFSRQEYWSGVPSPSPFADDMIFYVESPKGVMQKTSKLLKLMNNLNNTAGHKISCVVTHVNDPSKKEIKERIPSTVASKIIKYLGIK